MGSTDLGSVDRESDLAGRFVRRESVFRSWVSADGSTGFPAEAGRYHLYVSYACPWAHRTIIVRALKGLTEAISVSVVDPIRDERGWAFREGPGHGPDPVNGFSFLAEAYLASSPTFDGRVTVPVLWDRRTSRIVNNESAEIIRMLGHEFDAFGDPTVDLYPEELRREIDELNDLIYATVNNGVYRCGFAQTQAAYDEAIWPLFATLDMLEERLANRRYLTGPVPTEADWRLFPTLVRFDPVYVTHFKCNLRRLVEYRNLWGYTRDLYQWPGVAETVNLDHIRRHYFQTHPSINPFRIVPAGLEVDYGAAHGRA
ncbi:MAG: glutathione S-transferase family protein [Thermoleophilia bacterium]|nr:glutathione S-transferase family protein [Thermoleophilia bacterium]